MKLRSVCLLFLLGSVALAARAQVCSPESPLRRTLAVNVLDQQGNLVRGLTAADFRGEFRGQPVKILSAAPDTNPRRIVMLIDTSGSASEGVSPFAVARRAAEEMTYLSGAGNQVAVLTCGKEIKERIGFSQDREAIWEWLNAVPQLGAFEGSCASRAPDAVREALRVLGSPKVGDSLYPISDGSVKPGELAQTEEPLLSAGVRLFVLLLRRTQDDLLPDMTGVHPNDFLALAEKTGGAVIIPTWYVVTYQDQAPAREEQALAALVRAGQLYRQLHSQMAEFYRVDVQLGHELDESQGWKLEIVNAQGKRRKDVEVVYPRKLVPCGVSPPPGP